MTDLTPAPAPHRAPDSSLSNPRPYAAPALTALGAVDTITAGPIADGGNIDALVGLSGGFNVTTDPTS